MNNSAVPPSLTAPAGAALFAVNMLVNTERGDCYTTAEVASWMEAAGLVPGPVLELSPVSRVAVARRI